MSFKHIPLHAHDSSCALLHNSWNENSTFSFRNVPHARPEIAGQTGQHVPCASRKKIIRKNVLHRSANDVGISF